MRLVFPTLEYKEKAIEYINEFYEYGSEINGVGALNWFLKESTYEAWLQKVIADIDVANVEAPKVPALTYFFVREEDDRILGMANLRLALNDFLRTEGGHIGYSIRPTERRKRYGTRMLQEALKVYDRLSICEILVSCSSDNPASAGVIKNCGGELVDEFYSETFQENIQKYAIKRKEQIL
jgi:predicted acetyltransferase